MCGSKRGGVGCRSKGRWSSRHPSDGLFTALESLAQFFPDRSLYITTLLFH